MEKPSVSVSYRVVRGDGFSDAYWCDILVRGGCAVKGADDPWYRDKIPVKKRGQDIPIEDVPQLSLAVGSMNTGEELVVPHFGHFISREIFGTVAARLLAKAPVQIRGVEDGTVVLCSETDIEAGKALVKAALDKQKGRWMSERRKAAGAKTGPSAKALVGARRTQALDMFADLENWVSVQSIADLLGVSMSTVYRAVKAAAGHQDRVLARDMKLAGNWPPKPKRQKRKPKFEAGKLPEPTDV